MLTLKHSLNIFNIKWVGAGIALYIVAHASHWRLWMKALKTKIGLSSGAVIGCCSLCDKLPSLYAVKLICLFRSSAKDGCTRYEDFQSCYSTESMWHYRPSSERIQPLTGAPHEADFPFGNRWCQMVLAKFWQSQLGDPT